MAKDVLLTRLAIERDPDAPILFLDTGYPFSETYAFRERIAKELNLNLVNLLPEKTVAEQEAELGLLYKFAADRARFARFSGFDHVIPRRRFICGLGGRIMAAISLSERGFAQAYVCASGPTARPREVPNAN